MTKILIIRLSSIGDIILTTPVIRCLKKQIPDVEIHFCTKKTNEICIQHNPYLSKIHSFDQDFGALIQTLKSEKFDYVIDLHHNLRSLRIKASLTAQSYTFNKLNFRKWLLVNFKINVMPDIHIVDRYLATVKKLGVVNDGLGLDFPIPPQYKIDREQFPLAFRVGYAAIVIGAQHFTKRLPVEKVIEFASKIGQPIILIGGKMEFEDGEKIRKVIYDLDIPIVNTCGKYNLLESASLLADANFVLSNDTGMMHIAAALGKKIYVTWGNTVPSFGMYPYKTTYYSIENNNLSCRPCSKIGFSKCPKQHFDCMKKLEFTN
jgi:heptosyltransferase-2